MTHFVTDRSYIIHLRPYREKSALIQLFTSNHGVISAVIHGVSQPQKKASLQLYTPSVVTWKDKRSLKQISSFELEKNQPILTGKHLLWGMYLNELIYKLLATNDPYPSLFNEYEKCLYSLPIQQEESLRYFELSLLESIGYGFPDLSQIQSSHVSFHADYGLCEASDQYIPIQHIQALQNRKLQSSEEKQSAKIILRQFIQHVLGHHEIKTRQLVMPINKNQNKT